MSIKAINQFLQKVSEDTSLQSELTQALNLENAYQSAIELGAKHGYIFTPEQLKTEIHSRQNSKREELDEEELEAVAGGSKFAKFMDKYFRGMAR